MYPNINYVALGDSITTGVGAYISSSFTQHYTDMLKKHFHTHVNNKVIAKRKITSWQLLNFLNNPHVQRDIFYADIITIMIGGNDLLQANRIYVKNQNHHVFEKAVHEFDNNIRSIVSNIDIIKAHSHKPYIVQVIGLYNPYSELPYSDYWVSQFNKTLLSLTSHNVKYVETHSFFNYYGKSLLSFKGVHPNGKGHYLIAKQLMESLCYWQNAMS